MFVFSTTHVLETKQGGNAKGTPPSNIRISHGLVRIREILFELKMLNQPWIVFYWNHD